MEPEEPPGWRELIPPGTLHSLSKNQVKRQEVISGECHPLQPTVARDKPAMAKRDRCNEMSILLLFTTSRA